MSKAFMALGLPDTSTPDEVKAKWRELAMKLHPDRGGDGVEFHIVQKAYKIAMKEASAFKACPQCLGSGKVSKTNGWVSIDLPCQACGGAGHV